MSRSSALASSHRLSDRRVAAKLAIGYTLDEISSDITGGATPASFEPTIDYVVTKIPHRLRRFQGRHHAHHLDESVGEAMAIGRTFRKPAKALRSLDTGLSGLDEIAIESLR